MIERRAGDVPLTNAAARTACGSAPGGWRFAQLSVCRRSANWRACPGWCAGRARRDRPRAHAIFERCHLALRCAGARQRRLHVLPKLGNGRDELIAVLEEPLLVHFRHSEEILLEPDRLESARKRGAHQLERDRVADVVADSVIEHLQQLTFERERISIDEDVDEVLGMIAERRRRPFGTGSIPIASLVSYHSTDTSLVALDDWHAHDG